MERESKQTRHCRWQSSLNCTLEGFRYFLFRMNEWDKNSSDFPFHLGVAESDVCPIFFYGGVAEKHRHYTKPLQNFHRYLMMKGHCCEKLLIFTRNRQIYLSCILLGGCGETRHQNKNLLSRYTFRHTLDDWTRLTPAAPFQTAEICPMEKAFPRRPEEIATQRIHEEKANQVAVLSL